MAWLQFTFNDFLDILLLSFVLYYIYKALKTSGSRTLFTGIIAFVILWAIIYGVLRMKLMGSIMNQFMNVGIVVLVILFQEDIRRFLNALGSTKRWRAVSNLIKADRKSDDLRDSSEIAAITLACVNMARKKSGALIVIEQNIDLEPYKHTGELINADINARLIENIFFKNSPLHDGAMIISEHRIDAAGCILPVARNMNLPKNMGLRHRSGLGLAQLTDAKVIIISEERGKISVAFQGEIISDIDTDLLQHFLSHDLKEMDQMLHRSLH